MAVNLSPVGGVAAQFFDNDGNVLSGGKIYTYAAGTNTPQSTYTTGSGLVAHANPIILDSAGRVPTGEIWLTDGSVYKFVIKDANDTLIGTYDNIVGINSNFVNYSSSQEIQTATAGQTVFTLTTMAYQPATNTLSVFVDGVNQYGPGAQYAYTETSSTSVTFASGLHKNASVKFTTAVINNAGGVDASQVTYDPPFTGSVVTNVEAKLAQYISILDFGADPTGATDSTAAFNTAIATGKTIDLVGGTYKVANLATTTQLYLVSSGSPATIDNTSSSSNLFNLGTDPYLRLENINVTSTGHSTGWIIYSPTATLRHPYIRRCRFQGHKHGILSADGLQGTIDNLYIEGHGKNVAGGIGIQLGISASGPAGTTWTVQDVYFTGFETGCLNHSEGAVFIKPIFENMKYGLVSDSRGCVYGPYAICDIYDFDIGSSGSSAGLLILGYGTQQNKMRFYDNAAKVRTTVISDSNDTPTYQLVARGTWTPSVGGNATYTTQDGQYRRVGTMMHVTFNLKINTLGTGSASTISGLPFAAITGRSAGSLGYWKSVASSVLFINPYVESGATTIQFVGRTTASTDSQDIGTVFQDGTEIIGSITYETDTY